MKNRSTNNKVSGRYYWWAHTALVEVLHRRVRSEPPHIKDAFHMLRDNTACLFISEVIKKKYDFGGVLYNLPTEIFFPDKRMNDDKEKIGKRVALLSTGSNNFDV